MSEYLTNIRKWRPGDQPLHGPAGHDVTMSRGSAGTRHPRHAAFIARLLFSCRWLPVSLHHHHAETHRVQNILA